ncbi:hypothetical protein D3C83_272760 [compost metagenome]
MFSRQGLEVDSERIHEDLRHRAAVDVHLLIFMAAGFDVDQDWRELARNRRRSQHQ